MKWSALPEERKRSQRDPLGTEGEKVSTQSSELRTELKKLKSEAALTERLEELQSIDDAVYDLKAVNPNAKSEEDTRTPEELLDFIEAKGREIQAAIDSLRASHG